MINHMIILLTFSVGQCAWLIWILDPLLASDKDLDHKTRNKMPGKNIGASLARLLSSNSSSSISFPSKETHSSVLTRVIWQVDKTNTIF